MQKIFGPNKKLFESSKLAHNPYVEKLEKNETLPILSMDEMLAIKGNWHTIKKDDQPLILEIGCHSGLTLNEFAKNYPCNFYIGMDITYKRVYCSAQKAHGSKNSNVKTVLSDARHLHKIFAEDEIDGVLIFFPDPWPKLKHRKHRLVDSNFASQLRPALKTGGFVWFKSDSLDYYQQAFKAFKRSGYFVSKLNQPILKSELPTTFEKKFQKQQELTYEFYCHK